MSAQPLHIDLPDAEGLSVWPWLIALVSGACLIAIVAQQLKSIPESLQAEAQQLVSASGHEDLDVIANGRDLILVGTIDTRQSVAPLIDQLDLIDGVRIVRDDLTRIDVEQQAAQQTREFVQSLAGIETSAVAFQPGSNSFTAGSDVALKSIARLLTANPDRRIRIEGHTDDTGPAAVNLRLSQERAQAVASYLEGLGVASSQLIAKGYGSTQPIDDNRTEEGRARNRRIEISYVD
ncbi:MAG: OmpA family protein [Granulosicoccus sp.]|nr:OmpA family protein [Granulosicoccus sp.]